MCKVNNPAKAAIPCQDGLPGVHGRVPAEVNHNIHSHACHNKHVQQVPSANPSHTHKERSHDTDSLPAPHSHKGSSTARPISHVAALGRQLAYDRRDLSQFLSLYRKLFYVRYGYYARSRFASPEIPRYNADATSRLIADGQHPHNTHTHNTNALSGAGPRQLLGQKHSAIKSQKRTPLITAT